MGRYVCEGSRVASPQSDGPIGATVPPVSAAVITALAATQEPAETQVPPVGADGTPQPAAIIPTQPPKSACGRIVAPEDELIDADLACTA